MPEFDEALIPLAEADVLIGEAMPQGLWLALLGRHSGCLVIEGKGVGVFRVDVARVLSPIGVSVAT